jgi:SNF2 family DNA or RNA helicase
MLKLISKNLKSDDVKHLYLSGSYHTLNSKLRKFKLDTSIRIILLSSDNAASGLHLTEATHIVLMDTLNNDPEASKIIETQAIGRAVRIGQTKNVEVKRFIMRDTIEEEFYNKYMLSC